MGRGLLIAFLLGSLIGLSVPVAAQSVVRIYGTQSNGTITQILVTAAGRLVVVGS